MCNLLRVQCACRQDKNNLSMYSDMCFFENVSFPTMCSRAYGTRRAKGGEGQLAANLSYTLQAVIADDCMQLRNVFSSRRATACLPLTSCMVSAMLMLTAALIPFALHSNTWAVSQNEELKYPCQSKMFLSDHLLN